MLNLWHLLLMPKWTGMSQYDKIPFLSRVYILRKKRKKKQMNNRPGEISQRVECVSQLTSRTLGLVVGGCIPRAGSRGCWVQAASLDAPGSLRGARVESTDSLWLFSDLPDPHARHSTLGHTLFFFLTFY